MILTLGPLLAGASLAISSYLLSLRWASDLNTVIDNVLRILPLLLSWISFWLLYSIVPTTRVPNRDALVGAFVAALLFEAGKKGFALYITMFPSYQLIYGVLAVIPILFVWVYHLVYSLAWRRNNCHSRGIPKTQTSRRTRRS